jgi:hypothetical protein
MTPLRGAILINFSALLYILFAARYEHMCKTRLTKTVGWIYLVSFLAMVSLAIWKG